MAIPTRLGPNREEEAPLLCNQKKKNTRSSSHRYTCDQMKLARVTAPTSSSPIKHHQAPTKAMLLHIGLLLNAATFLIHLIHCQSHHQISTQNQLHLSHSATSNQQPASTHQFQYKGNAQQPTAVVLDDDNQLDFVPVATHRTSITSVHDETNVEPATLEASGSVSDCARTHRSAHTRSIPTRVQARAQPNNRQQRQFGRLQSEPSSTSGSNKLPTVEPDSQQAQDFTLNNNQQHQHNQQSFNQQQHANLLGELAQSSLVAATTQSAKEAQSAVDPNLPTPLNVVAPTTASTDTSQSSSQSPSAGESAGSSRTSANSAPVTASSLEGIIESIANSYLNATTMSNGSIASPSEQAYATNESSFASNQMQTPGEPFGPHSANANAATNRAGDRHHYESSAAIEQQVSSVGSSSSSQSSNEPAQSSYVPISNLPSSISVITPILGHRSSAATVASIGSQHQLAPAGQAQASSSVQTSSMVKPIYVLGTPLGERDYSHESQAPAQPTQQLQPMQPQQVNGNNSNNNQRNRAPKITDTQQLAPKQQDQMNQEPANELQQQSQFQQKKPHAATKNLDSQPTPLEPQPSRSEADQGAMSQTTPSPLSAGYLSDRMSGPSLIYTDGQLTHSDSLPPAVVLNTNATSASSQAQQPQQLPATPRLFQSQASYSSSNSVGLGGNSGAAVVGNNPRRPSLPPPVNQANAASGFRSPMSPSGPLLATSQQQQLSTVSLPPQQPNQQQQAQQQQTTALIQPPLNSVSMLQSQQQPTTLGTFYQTSLPPYLGVSSAPTLPNGATNQQQQQPMFANANQLYASSAPRHPYGNQQVAAAAAAQQLQQQQFQIQQMQQQQQQVATSSASGGSYSGRRPLNITRVEHISAECSNDLIRAVVVFNGTFKGIIYSSNYANDPTCLYINGTGSSRYEFSIRLNQCGTMNKVETHSPNSPGEARRRDQVMWNSLSIQYNPIIEQEWDEHFKVSCEYGSDFWKTVSFSPFNVVTNTGSPVVFTINPPQCQMDVLLGHGIGPKIAVDGPVTVGDPLTLLIHMKSEKAGYDILVKNCVAHNGGKQRMQLIDSNGCVVNERFISPFRGTYNDNDLRHVTLYAYLKAFRFTGSPVLYLECEIHMCQSACPPQMCYWRRLSKRSADDFEYEYTTNSSSLASNDDDDQSPHVPVISDSLNLFKALQVRQEPEPSRDSRRALRQQSSDSYETLQDQDGSQMVCYRHAEVFIFMMTIGGLWLLICAIAIACCLRVRKITRSQFNHDRLAAASYSASSTSRLSPPSPSNASAISGSLSPSLFSYATCAASSKGAASLLSPQQTNQHSTTFLWDAKKAPSHRHHQQTKSLYAARKIQGFC